MKIQRLGIPEVLLLEPRIFGDDRGFFMEVFVAPHFEEQGLPATFVQDNLSRSARGVLRGLHLQHPFGQGKLISVLVGEVFDVAVDVRVGSPTFGQWVSAVLSEANKQQLYIPPGFAHGLCVASEHALVSYKCTDVYHPESELGVHYDDPELAFPWPVAAPLTSARDRMHPRLREISPARLPSYAPPVERER